MSALKIKDKFKWKSLSKTKYESRKLFQQSDTSSFDQKLSFCIEMVPCLYLMYVAQQHS